MKMFIASKKQCMNYARHRYITTKRTLLYLIFESYDYHTFLNYPINLPLLYFLTLGISFGIIHSNTCCTVMYYKYIRTLNLFFNEYSEQKEVFSSSYCE